ncbi:MAG: hypothetical protein IT327_32685 [Anaerolineae bacterium]|nr:hypothetical protein [Anaerolineae bacterium]
MNRQINSAVLSLRQLRLRPFIMGLITILIPILFLISLGQFIDKSSNDLIDADILSFSDVAPLSAVLTDDETTDKAEIVEAPDSAWLQTVQNEIRQSEYRISWQENEPVSEATGAYQAPNRSHDFRTFFVPEGIRLQPRTETTTNWQWGLSLIGYGYDGHIRPVATAALTPAENRITYRRGQVTEWYINDERGLEQGFTIMAPPHLTAGKQPDNNNLPLILALNLTGNLTPKLQESGTAIDFHTADAHMSCVTVTWSRMTLMESPCLLR